MSGPGQGASMASNDLIHSTKSVFRARRARRLAQLLAALARKLGRPVDVLDLGGRAGYWDDVGLDNVGHVTILNNDEGNLHEPPTDPAQAHRFSFVLGDARKLEAYGDGAVDFVHSNSVIEHVGAWWDMKAMAAESVRVGRAGWMQTPAWEFPLEPHFRVPFMHWLAQPLRRKMLRLSPSYGGKSFDEKRLHADRINLLTRSEVRYLFPEGRLFVERFALLPKSYVVTWGEPA